MTAFTMLAAALWLGTMGYLLVLQAAASFRAPAVAAATGQLPPLAVVVPILNEEALIGKKLHDLLAADYPADRLRIVVVDGGSHDRSADIVTAAVRADARIALLRAGDASGKAAKINRALEGLSEEVVVVTDADARLDPGCLRELVQALLCAPETAMVGAAVSPDADMPEERAYWWFLNRLWWMEGEVLGSAMVSAAAYAVRRSRCPRLPDDVHCDDAFLTGTMGAQGARVRLCLSARATELRVPRSMAETLQFRFRRGCGYLRELHRIRPRPGAHAGWRIARGVRLFHIRGAPMLAALVAALALLLLIQGEWRCVASAAGAFAAGALAFLGPPRTAPAPRSFARWPRRAAAGVGAAALTWLSLMRIGWCTAAERNGGMSS